MITENQNLTPRPGQLISFLYPRHNYPHILRRMERRLLLVDEVKAGPPPAAAIDADPLLIRRGPLVIGRDHCRSCAVRSFYLGCAESVRILHESPEAAVDSGTAEGTMVSADNESGCRGDDQDGRDGDAVVSFPPDRGSECMSEARKGDEETACENCQHGSMEGAMKMADNCDSCVETADTIKVGIFVESELIDIVVLDDPRAAYCRCYNDLSENGKKAYPVSKATVLASSSLLSE